MGKFIIKASPDEDLYMEWSSIVDAPTAFFTSRKAVIKHLVEDYKKGTQRYDVEVAVANQRLDRADRFGSSAHKPFGSSWEDSGLIVQPFGEIKGWPDITFGWLPRANYSAYIKRYMAVDEPDEPDLTGLIEPCGDDDE